MFPNAPKLSMLSATIAASLGMALLPAQTRAADKTTLSTIITGSSQHTLHGYRKLVAQPNTAGRVARTLDNSPVPQNLKATQSLLAFGHMSDTQICDDQSPARVPFMDKRNDVDSSWDTGSAYRPQERLLPQMATAMVSSLRNLGAAPQTGLPLAFTLITGDMVDNSQYNETRTYIDIMDGGVIRPNHWLNQNIEEGPGYGGNDIAHKYNMPDWSYYSIKPSAYYHPDGYKWGEQSPPDWYRQHDFPVIPNLLSASRRNFVSPGLGMPWYAAFGNHDMSIQGNLPAESSAYFGLGAWAKDQATNSKRTRDVDIPYSKGDYWDWGQAVGEAILQLGDITHDVPASADPNRLVLDKSQFMDEHFVTNGLPWGHGFNTSGRPYYVIPSSGPNDRFKFIALDTTNNNEFGAGGWIDDEQWDWLVGELKAASGRYWGGDAVGWVTNPSASNKLIVLYMHHTLDSMNKVSKNPDGGWLGRDGVQLEQLLLRFPNVVMVVNGHTHRNRIRAHSVTGRWGPDSWKTNGFWEVTSPAAADFPVQSRVIEVALASTGDANGSQNNNYLSIYTTMLDIDAPVTFDTNGSMSDYRQLASVGRELSYNDPGDRTGSQSLGWRSGEASDRNTHLILPTPFPMNDFPTLGTSGVHIVTQKADTKDAKIVRMKSDGGFSGTIVDFSSSSLQGSEIVGTGQFTQGLKGSNFGKDLVLRDANGNIRIKLLGLDLKEIAYPGFGAEVRGSVDPDTELSGIGDLDADGRDDLIWRHGNGTVEVWLAGSIADRKYLNARKDYSSPTPDPGADQQKIVAVGDFNGDGYTDLMWEKTSDHSQFARYMQRLENWTDHPIYASFYNSGYDLQPGIGRVLSDYDGDQLVYRKSRLLTNSVTNNSIAIAGSWSLWGDYASTTVFYQNVYGTNAGADWQPVGMGDFNINGINDVLWRRNDGYFAIWWLKDSSTAPFAGDYGFSAGLGPEWVVKGVLKNTATVIY